MNGSHPVQLTPAEAHAAAAEVRASIMPGIIEPGRHIESNPGGALLGPVGITKVTRYPGREPHILQLLRTLTEFDSDASAAVWNLLRITNSGHEVHVRDNKGVRLAEGEQYLNGLAKDVWKVGGGGADNLVDTLLLSFFTFGGAGLEVEVSADTMDVEDFWPFAPYDIEFDYMNVPGKLSPQLVMFPARRFGKKAAPLNPIQVHYLPLDAHIDDPYGRSPLMPALSSILSLTSLLNEILNVTRIHGYGMRDIVIDNDSVIARAPKAIQEDPAALQTWLNDIRSGVETVVKKLRPWDTFVHYKWLQVLTTTPGGRGVDLTPVVAEFFRKTGTGLKTPPLMLGRLEGAQTQSTVEWQVYANGLNAMQNKAQRLVERGYNTALRVRGIPGTCHLEFEAIRDTDRQIAAAAEAAERANAVEEYLNGIINHEEMSLKLSRHKPTGPRPPTYADRFRLAVSQALAAQAALDPLTTPGPLDLPGWTPMDEDNLPEVPGSDAGLTSEEGDALDEISSNSATTARAGRARRTEALSTAELIAIGRRIAARYGQPFIREADPPVADLPNNAAAVLGADIVEDTRDLLRELGRSDLLDILDAEEAEPDEDEDEGSRAATENRYTRTEGRRRLEGDSLTNDD